MVGKAGVEQSYNKLLMGKDGDKLVVVNSRGREMGEASKQPPIEGRRVQLTIDADVQRATEEGFAPLRLQRRGGHPRSALGRSPVVHQPARLQPEPVRRRHRPRRLEFAADQRPEAAAEPRAAGTLLAGIDVQDCGRHGGARRRRRRRRTSACSVRAARPSTAATSSATSRAATARSTCGTRSRSRATSTSTRSATCSASTASTSGRRCSGWASGAASTCRTSSRGWCRRPSGRRRRASRSGIRARRSRSRSARDRST